jgi:hypothetical protein
VYAHREDASRHAEYRDWLRETMATEPSYGLSDFVLSSFVRLVTHPGVFKTPTPLTRAFEFTDAIRDRANCVHVVPGNRHWSIFRQLCSAVGAKANLVPDTYLAALAIESGSEWITTDRDYSRFPGLRWRHPFD